MSIYFIKNVKNLRILQNSPLPTEFFKYLEILVCTRYFKIFGTQYRLSDFLKYSVYMHQIYEKMVFLHTIIRKQYFFLPIFLEFFIFLHINTKNPVFFVAIYGISTYKHKKPGIMSKNLILDNTF